MAIDGDQAAGIHGSGHLHVIGQTTAGKRTQRALLLIPGVHPRRVASVQHPVQELQVLLLGVEVAAAAEPQGDVQLEKKMTVRRFDRAVLVRASDVDRARLQPVMIQQRAERCIEAPLLSFADPVRDAAAVVHLQARRHAPGPIQGLAHRGLQAQEVLGAADCGPFPARKREDRVTQQMPERHAANGHAQVVRTGPVDLQPAARPMHLLEEHFPGNRTRTPAAETPLQRPKLSVLVTSRIQKLEPAQRHGRGQVRHNLEHADQLAADCRERVEARLPPVRSPQLRRQLPRADVFRRGGTAHVRPQSTGSEVPGRCVDPEKPLYLSIRNHRRCRGLNARFSPRTRPARP